MGLVGDGAFSDAMIDLLLRQTLPRDAIAAAATPGGTGAVRQALNWRKWPIRQCVFLCRIQPGPTICQFSDT